MPLAKDDQQRVDEAENEANEPNSNKLLVRDPIDSQKLGPFTVICTILNRSIGSGIFVLPALVLRATGSVGASLLLWTLGAVYGIAGLLVWLELGLSIPKFQPPDSTNEPRWEGERPLISVPRNGGVKNYLEYIYRSPRFRTTCMYGIVFVVLGNLSGNAIAFGIYVMEAAGRTGPPSAIRGLAILALTLACLVHGLWRKGGIYLNNILSVLKVAILLAIIGIGFSASANASFGHRKVHGETFRPVTFNATSNFDTHTSFAFATKDAATYADCTIFVIFPFSGFEQPFYVLSEVARPKKVFAKSTISAMVIVAILFVLVNIAYLCAVPNDPRSTNDLEMATLFFKDVFQNDVAPRVMSAIIAVSIFGNIVVMTFTASRVKQEIAKEGILPGSRFFARSTTTPYAWIKERWWPSNTPETSRVHSEQSPMAALLLHWTFTVILIAVTSGKKPFAAYSVLVSLYSYVINIMVGFFVANGLLYLRWSSREEWTANAGFSPWGGPTAAIIYSLVCTFAIIGAFLKPIAGSPFGYKTTDLEWYVVPTIGLGTLIVGYAYYFGYAVLLPRWKHKARYVDRQPIIVRQFGKPDGEWVQVMELVEHGWGARNELDSENIVERASGDHDLRNLGGSSEGLSRLRRSVLDSDYRPHFPA